MFEVIEIHEGKGALCRDILESLPEWFGIPEAIDSYVQGVEQQPMLACKDSIGEQIIGFLSLRFHTPYATEAYVLGVRREWQRRGCGTALFDAACQFAKNRGARFLTVKTLGGNRSRSKLCKDAVILRKNGISTT